jgi:Xaa-Pro dipeptidase
MEFFAEHVSEKLKRYQEAMSACGIDQVIIASGAQQYQFSDDIPLTYVANAYFREWLPLLDRPDCFLVISSSSDKPKLVIKIIADYWHSAAQAIASPIQQAFDIVEYSTDKDRDTHFPVDTSAAFIGPENSQLCETENTALNSLLSYINFYRAWKTRYEMHTMREANRLAVRGHRAAEKAFCEGLSEYQIHMAYLSAAGCREEQLPYPNIVALNEHCGVLHHNSLQTQQLSDNRSLLIDAGAQFNGYASDITRTLIKEGGDPCFAELIAGVDQLQQALVSEVKAGVDYSEIHHQAHVKIAHLLASLEIIRVSAEQAIEQSVTNLFFPHGVGHLIGVQVHDKGGYQMDVNGAQKLPDERYSFLRCTRTIADGMAFTIEPGVYFIPMLLDPWRGRDDLINWSLVDQLRPYGGVRIEDDIIVHHDHIENLTRDAFSQLE